MMCGPATPYHFNLADMCNKPLMQGNHPSPLRLIGAFVFESHTNISKYVMVHKRLHRKPNINIQLVI